MSSQPKGTHSLSFLIFTLCFILIFAGLGTWQLQRKTEKEALLHTLTTVWEKEVQDVDHLQDMPHVTPLYATGHYLPGKTIFLQAKTYQGKRGVYVLDLFQTNGGKYLLVQRGWSASEDVRLHTNKLTLEGIGRTPSRPTYFQPANTPPTYFWIDLALLSKEWGVPLLPYYMVAKSSDDPRILPTPPFPLPSNNHLEYALTWYSLAFTLLVVLLWLIKNRFLRRSYDGSYHNA
jgi:surfeit locus 1 family protein